MTEADRSDEAGQAEDALLAHRRGVRRIGVLSAILLIGATVLAASVGVDRPAFRQGPWWLGPLVLVAYAATSRFAFHVEFRRDAVTFTLAEVPTALALAFLTLPVAVTLRLVGGVGAMLVGRRTPAYKTWFNVSLFAFEVAAAYAIFGALADLAPGDDRVLLPAIVVATAVSSTVGPLTVPAAIASFEGGYLRRLGAEIRTGLMVAMISATIAGLTVAPALISPLLIGLVPLPTVAVWSVIRRHGILAQQHRDLEQLHDFARIVGRSLRYDDIARGALDAALESLRARRGTLQIYAPDGSIVVEQHVRDGAGPVPTDASDPAWADIIGQAGATCYALEADGTAHPAPGPSGRIATPITDRDGTLGLLLVAERLGAADRFDGIELGRATRLADRLAVHLRNAALHADIEHAALHDGLTGDHNRLAFEDAVTDALAHRSATGTLAVLMLDLDRFKDINDTLGHHMGDRVLVEFARRVRELCEPDDVLARFGGDEFALLVRRDDPADVRALADRIVAHSHRALDLAGYDVVVATSVGVALVADDDHDANAVIRRADLAMFTAKRNHLGYEMYREEIDRRTPERLALLGDLRTALERDQIEVYFQPKLDLTASTVIGAEALARWQHPARGWVPPSEFVRVAEESGLVRQLTDRVLSLALAAAAEWRADGRDLSIAVNLSALDLVDEHLPDRVERGLREHALPPDVVTLEITESALMVDTPRTMATVERLHALGIQLSLDDFGTGYSSLTYLRRLPATELKVDRSFVTNLLLDAQDEAIVRSTVDLGHNLGLRVVAEGVENEPMLRRLRAIGCDLGQGYGISRPLDRERFGRWLDRSPHEVRPLASAHELPAVTPSSSERN